MNDPDTSSPLPIGLIAGLGNPGDRYRRTRHNLGRRVVEELARRLDAGKPRDRYAGRLWQARGPGGPVALLVPTTFMNLSGDSVGPAMGALKLSPAQVLVIHDEVDLPFGTVRGKVGGGVAGHNGLRSVRAGLGTTDFLRIRLGVGRPGDCFRGDTAAWVLAAPTEPEGDVEAMVMRGADMAERALADGMDAAVAAFHAREPGARRKASPQPSDPSA
ncbi:MAG: aminoacyl-tRNA hydrolase [Thermoleophilia bacterium]|nr:aminoacyl-tRNA hydrolase [Thermoleophilia bacterium]